MGDIKKGNIKAKAVSSFFHRRLDNGLTDHISKVATLVSNKRNKSRRQAMLMR